MSGWALRTGWRSDLEQTARSRQEFLAAAINRTFVRPSSIPDAVDPRPWLRIEDQRQTSSCVGHATSSCAEALYWIATRGQVIQLSRWQAYISAQREDGLEGRDQGAMISGAVTSTEKRGICTEELCPFTGKYFTQISQAAWADAETRQIRSHIKITDFQQALDWIGGGMGTVIIGIPVGQQFMNNSGLIDRVDSSGGGHALAIVGYETVGSAKQLLLANSWNTSWGKQGWANVTARAFDTWCQQAQSGRSEVWGLSDIESPEPRDMGWIGYFT